MTAVILRINNNKLYISDKSVITRINSFYILNVKNYEYSAVSIFKNILHPKICFQLRPCI